MPGNSDPSRIYHDPALTDRRGDATGPVALLFLALVIGAFAAVTWGLVTYLPVAADPSPRPRPTSLFATAHPTPTPAPTRLPATSDAPPDSPDPGIVTPSPDDLPPTTPEAGPTDGPLPSRPPRRTPTPAPSGNAVPTAAAPSPQHGAMGDTITVVRNGKRVGSVRMTSFAAAQVPGIELRGGARVMAMDVTYSSPAGMRYDARHWVIEDTDGKRYTALDVAPAPALGAGRVPAGGTASGKVAFLRERRIVIASIILTDGAGTDLVVIERPPIP